MLIVKHFPEILSKEFINKKLILEVIKLQNMFLISLFSMTYCLSTARENVDETLIFTPLKTRPKVYATGEKREYVY